MLHFQEYASNTRDGPKQYPRSSHHDEMRDLFDSIHSVTSERRDDEPYLIDHEYLDKELNEMIVNESSM
jgi:hypothetical protein